MNRKKIVRGARLLPLLLALSVIAGCGDEGATTTTGAAATTPEETTATTEAATPTTSGTPDTTGETPDSTLPPVSAECSAVRISATSVDSLPYFAILQAPTVIGWFEEAGLDVTFFSGAGGGNTLRALTTGDAEIALTGGPAVVLAAQGDLGVKLVGTWFPVNDVFWIAPEDRPVENATLGVTSPGSTTQLVASYVAEKLGSGISIVELGGGMGDSWAAAVAGEITAGWAIHPFVTDKIRNENASIIIDAREVIGDFPLDLAAASTEFAEACPGSLTAFFAVSDRALEWVREDTEAAAAELSPIMNLDAGLIVDSIHDTPNTEVAYSLAVEPESLAVLSDMMLFTEQITEPVDWATLFDQQFLPESARADLSG